MIFWVAGTGAEPSLGEAADNPRRSPGNLPIRRRASLRTVQRIKTPVIGGPQGVSLTGGLGDFLEDSS